MKNRTSKVFESSNTYYNCTRGGRRNARFVFICLALAHPGFVNGAAGARGTHAATPSNADSKASPKTISKNTPKSIPKSSPAKSAWRNEFHFDPVGGIRLGEYPKPLVGGQFSMGSRHRAGDFLRFNLTLTKALFAELHIYSGASYGIGGGGAAGTWEMEVEGGIHFVSGIGGELFEASDASARLPYVGATVRGVRPFSARSAYRLSRLWAFEPT